MPRITISEEDLTIANDFDIAANVVYVPGITKADVSEPKLYRSVAEFLEDFPVVTKDNKPGVYVGKFDLPQTISNIAVPYGAKDELERSYIYALELLNAGLPVLFHNVVKYNAESATNIQEMYNQLYTNQLLSKLLDRWTYQVKFVTLGGYPALNVTGFPIYDMMLGVAGIRADAISILDIELATNEDIIDVYNLINTIITNHGESYYELTSNKGNEQEKWGLEFKVSENRASESILKYGQIIVPGATYQLYQYDLITSGLINEKNEVNMPGSFGYLLSLINSVNTLKNPDYLAVAGVNRGLVPNIKALLNETTGAEAEAVQEKTKGKASINPIVNVTNYGLCIWGNRTLFPNQVEGDLSASSFLNLRVLAADVKKNIYAACQQLTFETNSIELWLKFRTKVEPILEQMITNGGLEDYELRRLESDKKATLSVYVKLITLYAVEDFNITVGLTDSTVEEIE